MIGRCREPITSPAAATRKRIIIPGWIWNGNSLLQFTMILPKLQKTASARTVKSPISIFPAALRWGNIFQLGDKYTRSMQMTYLDQNGESHHPVMVATALGSGGWLPRYAKHITTTTALSGLSPSLPGRCICALCRADDPAVRACADQLYETCKERDRGDLRRPEYQCRRYVFRCGSAGCANTGYRQPPQPEGKLLRNRHPGQIHLPKGARSRYRRPEPPL